MKTIDNYCKLNEQQTEIRLSEIKQAIDSYLAKEIKKVELIEILALMGCMNINQMIRQVEKRDYQEA